MIGVIGFLAVFAWISWRFGPTLLRVAEWSAWWVAWACGSQGGYGYCVAFLVLGAVSWGGGTIWYANRRGRWPSAVSARLLARLLDMRNPVTYVEAPTAVSVPRGHHRAHAPSEQRHLEHP